MIEVNKEIRNKIMQLIVDRLENITGEPTFHGLAQNNCWSRTPVYTISKTHIFNCDKSEYIGELKCMKYTLEFEDGEPSIQIYTHRGDSSTEEPYKTVWKWFRKKQHVTTTRIYSVKTRIGCGHMQFYLTNEEHDFLADLTEKAYEKHLSLAEAFKDDELMVKLNKRLEK